ncbi:hypothetical protein RUM44_009262 [Polyplax serrata]|uniref:Calx-beta domain-containing protein n=1 Tax=Polyplax serrata TaxID=468196 RepID=A0ABR1AS75_POLSC
MAFDTIDGSTSSIQSILIPGDKMDVNVTDTEFLTDTRVCPQGLIFPLLDESGWNPVGRAVLYFLALLYAFIGVSVVTDIFMGAVVTITSKTKKVYLAKYKVRKGESDNSLALASKGDEPDFIEVRVWNDTVANLTLMALGTSAPEILLACIELIGHNFESGELGPGTIVGSGAFNLLIITAICVMSIPKGESRRIRLFKVFLVCSLFSIFAYIWLWVVLIFISPHIVELWEAIVTFLMFPGLVFFAYTTDRGWCGLAKFTTKGKRQVDIERVRPEESEKMFLERRFFKDGKVDKEGLIAFVKELKKYPGVSDEDAAVLAASKIIDAQPQSLVHYRIGAIRGLTGARKIRPQLSVKLQEVYETINQHPLGPNLGEVPEISPETHAVIEFHAATCAVHENIGSFYVTIWRHGNVDPIVKVRVESVDGSAKVNEDYVKVDEIITFEPGVSEKQVLVHIIDDNKWEPDEEFFLKLSLVDKPEGDLVQLGRISIMEITILDDDKPGIISFEKRGVLVKESAGVAILNVRRKFGADGEVSVKWRTINDSAIAGRDFVGGEGKLVFKHREILKTIEIPLIDDLRPEKDEVFVVELFSPSNNASLGNINKTCVTITNDDAFARIIDKMMAMTSANLDSLAVCRKTWAAQMKDAMNVNGGQLEDATLGDYVLHLISFHWKVLFSLIPPPNLLGGWICFVVSLGAIGFVTAIIGDLASIFGCVVGLRDSITAITLVAMGTSLPDTFASKAAALKEQYADTSVGNITGSNSVNVFLGLGLPWLIATIYHAHNGTEFRVPAGTLGFTVLMFSICAVIAIGLLVLRRNLTTTGKAELGGPLLWKFLSGGCLISLWVLYIVVSCLQEYGYIHVNF